MEEKDERINALEFEIPKKIAEEFSYFGLTGRGLVIFAMLLSIVSLPLILVYLLAPLELFVFIAFVVIPYIFHLSKVDTKTGIMNITYTIQNYQYKRASKEFRMMRKVNHNTVVEFDFENWGKGDNEDG